MSTLDKPAALPADGAAPQPDGDAGADGLTHAQAAARLAQTGPNALPQQALVLGTPRAITALTAVLRAVVRPANTGTAVRAQTTQHPLHAAPIPLCPHALQIQVVDGIRQTTAPRILAVAVVVCNGASTQMQQKMVRRPGILSGANLTTTIAMRARLLAQQ